MQNDFVNSLFGRTGRWLPHKEINKRTQTTDSDPPVELKSKKQYCPRENSNPFGGTSTEAKITLNAVIEGDANISFHSPTTVTRDFPAAF